MSLRPFRLCLVFALLAPSLVHAAALGIPGDGTTLSGIGVISGWKCQANGDLTIRFDGGEPIPLLYGSERTDVRDAGACPTAEVGFVAIWNWSNLEAGEHTAVAYDNGVEFARSTFTVVRASEEESFLRDVVAECTVPDFPDTGTNARFEWSQGTQHLELAEVGEDVVVPVSTRFDGEWELIFELEQDISGSTNSVCPCYDEFSLTKLVVVNGKFASGWTECGQTNVGLYALISPTGQLESSFGIETEDSWASIGSLDGFLRDDGTGGGEWIHVAGCIGSWSAQRRGDS